MAEHDQLVAGGLSRSAIYRQARSGRLIRKYRRVYAVGHDALTPDGERMAAVLAGGPGTALSHRGAGGAWGVRPDGRPTIDITAPTKRGAKQPGLTVHECRLHPDDVTTLRGVPITTVPRTLLDLAEIVPRHHLRRAVERALELRIYDQREVDATLRRGAGRHGLKPLRQVIAELVGRPEGSRRELEARALDLIREHALPWPAVNTLVGRHEVDLLWRAQRLVVELDSWSFHGTRPAFERDRERDADLLLAGYRVLRVTWQQVTREPERVAARIGALLEVGAATG